MLKKITTAIMLLIAIPLSVTVHAEITRFTLTPKYEKTTSYRTKSIGVATFNNQIKIPTYAVYQEDPIDGDYVKKHPKSLAINYDIDKKHHKELAIGYCKCRR